MGFIIALAVMLIGYSVYTDFRPLLFIVIGVLLTLKIIDRIKNDLKRDN